MIVYFFGDSITQGFWDSEGGWPARVRKHSDAKFLSKENSSYNSFFNLGIDGNTTRNIIHRFDDEVEARLWQGAEYVFVFATGTNDTIFRGSENFNEPDSFEEELSSLYAKARQYSQSIFFLGLTPVQDDLLNPMPWSKSGKCYSTERMQLFDNVLRAFCEQYDTTYIDIWNDFEAQDIKKVMYDGVHPNSLGHLIISEKIIQALGV